MSGSYQSHVQIMHQGHDRKRIQLTFLLFNEKKADGSYGVEQDAWTSWLSLTKIYVWFLIVGILYVISLCRGVIFSSRQVRKWCIFIPINIRADMLLQMHLHCMQISSVRAGGSKLNGCWVVTVIYTQSSRSITEMLWLRSLFLP